MRPIDTHVARGLTRTSARSRDQLSLYSCPAIRLARRVDVAVGGRTGASSRS